MQVHATLRLGTAGPAKGVRRAPGGTGFAVAGEESAPPPAAAVACSIGGIDTLLALQGVEDAAERRSRGIARGRHLLDALEALKLGLLAGTVDRAGLERLKLLAADPESASGDPRLDDLLAQIRLRAQVELAKAGLR
jgi:hypothetical protein